MGMVQKLGSKASLFDHVAALAHQAFNRLAGTIMESMSGRKVLAALIMRTAPDDGGTVISIGTGNTAVLLLKNGRHFFMFDH